MNIGYKEPREITPDELQVIELLGDQAALAVENAPFARPCHKTSVDGPPNAFTQPESI